MRFVLLAAIGAFLAGCNGAGNGQDADAERVTADGVAVQAIADEPFLSVIVQDKVAYALTPFGDIWQIDSEGPRKVIVTGVQNSFPLLVNENYIWVPVPLWGEVLGYALDRIGGPAPMPLSKTKPDITLSVPKLARPNSVSQRFLTGWVKYGLGEMFVIDLQTEELRQFNDVGNVLADGDHVLYSDAKTHQVMQLTDLNTPAKRTQWQGHLMSVTGELMLVKDGWYVAASRDGHERPVSPARRFSNFRTTNGRVRWIWSEDVLYNYDDTEEMATCSAPDQGRLGLQIIPISAKRAIVMGYSRSGAPEQTDVWIAERNGADLSFSKWLSVRGVLVRIGCFALGDHFYFNAGSGVHRLPIPAKIDRVTNVTMGSAWRSIHD